MHTRLPASSALQFHGAKSPWTSARRTIFPASALRVGSSRSGSRSRIRPFSESASRMSVSQDLRSGTGSMQWKASYRYGMENQTAPSRSTSGPMSGMPGRLHSHLSSFIREVFDSGILWFGSRFSRSITACSRRIGPASFPNAALRISNRPLARIRTAMIRVPWHGLQIRTPVSSDLPGILGSAIP